RARSSSCCASSSLPCTTASRELCRAFQHSDRCSFRLHPTPRASATASAITVARICTQRGCNAAGPAPPDPTPSAVGLLAVPPLFSVPRSAKRELPGVQHAQVLAL